jgi:hypothetical protein
MYWRTSIISNTSINVDVFALRAGAWHRCRRVEAPVATVPNCPSQEPICASLQCSCRSQSLERLQVRDAGGSRRSYRNGRV